MTTWYHACKLYSKILETITQTYKAILINVYLGNSLDMPLITRMSMHINISMLRPPT